MTNIEALNRLYLQRVQAHMAYCAAGESKELERAYQGVLLAEGNLKQELERETGLKLRISPQLDGYRFDEVPAKLARRSRVR